MLSLEKVRTLLAGKKTAVLLHADGVINHVSSDSLSTAELKAQLDDPANPIVASIEVDSILLEGTYSFTAGGEFTLLKTPEEVWADKEIARAQQEADEAQVELDKAAAKAALTDPSKTIEERFAALLKVVKM
jgi:hypothetical protein